LAEESRVGARIEIERLPVTAPVHRVAAARGGTARAWATGGGEDYELLFTCDRSAWEGLRDGLWAATGRRAHAIGEIVTAASGVTFVDGDGTPVALAPGFEHFAA
jgi:thiamine-monophosphate kinase